MICLLPQATITRVKGQRPVVRPDRIAFIEPPPPAPPWKKNTPWREWLDTCVQERMVARLYRLFQGEADVRVYTDGERHRLQIGRYSAPVWILDGEIAFTRWGGRLVTRAPIPKCSGDSRRREDVRRLITNYTRWSAEGLL